VALGSQPIATFIIFILSDYFVYMLSITLNGDIEISQK
jgi:hypothetical protein